MGQWYMVKLNVCKEALSIMVSREADMRTCIQSWRLHVYHSRSYPEPARGVLAGVLVSRHYSISLGASYLIAIGIEVCELILEVLA
jgi:hypothetical protein